MVTIVSNFHSREVQISPEEHFAEANRKILRYHFSRFLAIEQEKSLKTDIEAVHDCRVAIRRMRSALALSRHSFAPLDIKIHQNRLKNVGNIFGRVRDYDVLLVNIYKVVKTHPGYKHGLDPIISHWKTEREISYYILTDYLQSEEYAAFIKEFNYFVFEQELKLDHVTDLAKPIPCTVSQLYPAMVLAQLAKVRSYQHLFPITESKPLHELRIEIKKFRYMLEFFQNIMSPAITTVIPILKKMQDHLGESNDITVASNHIKDLLNSRHLPQLNDEQLNIIKRFLHNEGKIQNSHIKSFEKSWSKFETTTYRRKLFRSLSGL